MVILASHLTPVCLQNDSSSSPTFLSFHSSQGPIIVSSQLDKQTVATQQWTNDVLKVLAWIQQRGLIPYLIDDDDGHHLPPSHLYELIKYMILYIDLVSMLAGGHLLDDSFQHLDKREFHVVSCLVNCIHLTLFIGSGDCCCCWAKCLLSGASR